MGHIRLQGLPRTRTWIQVLDLIGEGAGTPEVAAATMDASQGGLAKAAKDPGLVHTVWLLTQVLCLPFIHPRAPNLIGLPSCAKTRPS